MDNILLAQEDMCGEGKIRFLEALNANEVALVENYLQSDIIHVDQIFYVEDEHMKLAAYKPGFWLPNYKLQSSSVMPLHMAAALGREECTRVLLRRGADPNAMPNGKTPLHVACLLERPAIVSLLLEYGADPDKYSTGGLAAIHYCTTLQSLECSLLLLSAGADVNLETGNTAEEMPLHTAARCGLPEHAALYVSHGAEVDGSDGHDETPLCTAIFWALSMRNMCVSPQHHKVCERLLTLGADPNGVDTDRKSALHRAAWNADCTLLELLLSAGAHVNQLDGLGCTALQYIVRVVSVRPTLQPERCIQMLLNHGSVSIYPLQFHKVLELCGDSPTAVEILVNSYKQLRITHAWAPALSQDAREAHGDFYASLLHFCNGVPRSLLHLSRCAIRGVLGERCHCQIPRLPLPARLRDYLLLDPEGIIY
ncbi:ankyrin repeat and SOCS box protein 4-like [Lampetra fluviatilis]